jgi:hypothetical protein
VMCFLRNGQQIPAPYRVRIERIMKHREDYIDEVDRSNNRVTDRISDNLLSKSY